MRDDVSQDDILFDRLADGELSEADRRRLLASLDERPDGWRRCALAFLEAQSWRGDLRQIVAASAPTHNANDLARPHPDHRKPPRQALAWLAIAASVLVATTLVLMQRDAGYPIATVETDTDGQLAVIAPPNRATPAPLDDALTLWVRDDAGKSRPLRVPLVDADTLDRELGVEFQSALSSRIRERLQERGYAVHSKRRYAPLWLENGRPMIVPVEDTKIVPVGQNVYEVW